METYATIIYVKGFLTKVFCFVLAYSASFLCASSLS